jgi:hypothetical protein
MSQYSKEKFMPDRTNGETQRTGDIVGWNSQDSQQSSPLAVLKGALSMVERGDVNCRQIYICMEVVNPQNLAEVGYPAFRAGGNTLEHLGLLEVHKKFILDEEKV